MNESHAALPYLGKPEDVAAMVAFLASDAARFISGQVIAIDGGTTAQLPTVTAARALAEKARPHGRRSEEHTSELQSLMRISYAVFCLKKKTKTYSYSTNISKQP